MDEKDISKMKVADIKRELKLRNLSTVGNKNELIDRLQASLLDRDATSLDDTNISEELLEDDDVLNEDELLEETKLLLESNHEDAVLKSPLASPLSKTPPPQVSETTTKKVILKRKLTMPISIPTIDNTKTDSASSLKDSFEFTSKTSDVTVNPQTDGDTNGNKVVKLVTLSAAERLELRAKKFGASAPTTVDAQKAAREIRFGAVTKKDNALNLSSVEALQKRAQRFGGSVSTVMNKMENNEKLLKRKERFGAGGASGDYAEKARLRLERFKSK